MEGSVRRDTVTTATPGGLEQVTKISGSVGGVVRPLVEGDIDGKGSGEGGGYTATPGDMKQVAKHRCKGGGGIYPLVEGDVKRETSRSGVLV